MKLKCSLIVAVAGALLLLPVQSASAKDCPSLTMTGSRAAAGSAWDLEKVQNEMRRPVHREDLILVVAHRGAWDYCPENTIEGAMVAMDQKLEAIELDVRVTQNGIPFLTHDWDLRGEALNPEVGRSRPNNIYTLTERRLGIRVKPDRYGEPGKSNGRDIIYFQSFKQFLETYLKRVKLIPKGVLNGQIVRGSVIVVDIKGEDAKVKDLPASAQYGSLKSILKVVKDFETTNNVDLRNVLIYKLNLKSMTTKVGESGDFLVPPEMFIQEVRTLKFQYNPGLVFIIYPEDYNDDKPNGQPRKDYDILLRKYQKNYAEYIGADWQARFPGINLEPFVKQDIMANRGAGAFVSYNPFPEGMRRSDGTCDRYQQFGATECLQQGLQKYASAAIEFFFPPKGKGLPLLATSITTDMFDNAVNYLKVTDRRDTQYIAWKTSSDQTTSDQAPTARRDDRVSGDPKQVSGSKAFDVVVNGQRCSGQKLFDQVNAVCVGPYGKLMVDQTRRNFYNRDDGLKQPSVAPLYSMPREIFTKGFTVAIEVDRTDTDVRRITDVLTVTDDHGIPAFSVLRGAEGAWYVGKQIDRVFTQNFDTKLWDPVSPCAKRVCARETIYVSFKDTGEVRLDDFAIFQTPTNGQAASWQSGLMNYGMPVTYYRRGTDSQWPNWPVLNPAFEASGSVGLGVLPTDWFGAESEYRNKGVPFTALKVSRFAVWTDGMLGGQDFPQALERAILVLNCSNTFVY